MKNSVYKEINNPVGNDMMDAANGYAVLRADLLKR